MIRSSKETGPAVLINNLFQGGDPVKFRLINDAYNRLIAHVDKQQRMEMEAELRFESL